MATNSSAFSGSTNAKYQILYLVFNQVSQDIANNRTLFSYEAYIQSISGGSGSTTAGSYSITGATTANASSQSWSWNTTTKKTIATGSFYVSHNSDGTLANQTINISASFKTTSGTLTSSTSVSLAVPTIPRYAAITGFTASINDMSASLSWTADKTISQWRWSADSGGWYSGWITVNASSGSTSLSVSPGSAYGFQIQVISSASGLTTTSSVVSKTATKTPSTLSLSTRSQYVGNNINWTVNESYAYTHKITYYFGNTSGYILGSDSAASDTANGAWTVPMELANQIPNATSGSGTIYVYTYYGGVHVGTNSYTFTAVVPDNVTFQPTATISSIAQGTTLPSGITVFVQNQSKAKVTSTGTAKYSASINTYSVSVAGIGTYTGSVITSEFLKNSGNVRVTLTVTDSRGLKGSTYQDITVFAYSPPQLPTFNASRSESTPAEISANFSASISPINNQNNKYFRMRSKASDGGWIVETDTTQNYTFSGTQIIVSSPDKSYTIEFFVQDSFTSITQTVQVGTAFTLIDYNNSGKGMAIGKVSERDAFEIGMPLYANSYRQPLAYSREVTFQNTYTYAFSVTGDRLSSLVRFSARGTSGSVVINANVEILVNHSHSILISGTSGNYTQLSVQVKSNADSNFDVYLKHNGGTTTGVLLEIIPIGEVSIGFTSNGYATAVKELSLVTNGYSTTGANSGGSGSVSWAEVTGKPSTFAPSTHNHVGTVTTGSETTHTTAYGSILLGPMNSGYAHIYSTLAVPFYFNQPILVNGNAVSMAGHTHGYTRTQLCNTTVAQGGNYTVTNVSTYDLLVIYAIPWYSSATDANILSMAIHPSRFSAGNMYTFTYSLGTNRGMTINFTSVTNIKIGVDTTVAPRVIIDGYKFTN